MASRSSGPSDGGDDDAAAAWLTIERALEEADRVDLDWLGPLPPVHSWPLDGASLRFLSSLVAELQPRHVLEFGSGLSTFVIARACGECAPGGHVSTIENDPLFVDRIRRRISVEAPSGSIAVQLAPLVLRKRDGATLPAYHLQPTALASREPAALVLIDGPSALLGGRSGALFQAMEFARQGTVILLDDADRDSEKDALAIWEESFRDLIEVRPIEGLTNFAAIVVTSSTIPTRGSWWLDEPPDWREVVEARRDASAKGAT